MDKEIPNHVDIDGNGHAEATGKGATDASNVPVPIEDIQEMSVERKSESKNSSEDTAAHSPNLGDRSIRRRSPTYHEIVRFRNKLKWIRSTYFSAFADCYNIYRKDADENDAASPSIRRGLTYDEADRELNPTVNSYRDKKSFSGNSSANAESESSTVSTIDNLGQQLESVSDDIRNAAPCHSENAGLSGVTLPELKQKSSSTLAQESEKLTQNGSMTDVMNCDFRIHSDLSSAGSSPVKDKPFSTKDDLDEEYIPDTESKKSSECQKGTAIRYKSFRNPEKNATFPKRKYDDDGYVPDGESTSSSEHEKSTAKSSKLFSQIDYSKSVHYSFLRDSLLKFSLMVSHLDEIWQRIKKATLSAKKSSTATCSAFIPSTEEINTNNNHEVSLEEGRMNTIIRINTETPHIHIPTVPKEERYSSTPELRERNTGNLEVSRKDSLYKSSSLTDSQTELMLTVEGESTDNSCEQYSRKRKTDSSENSPLDEHKEKFFKAI